MTEVTTLTPQERSDFNALATHADNTGTSVVDPAIINSYKGVNPQTTLTPDHIPVALAEVNNLKNGVPLPGMSPENAAYLKSGMSPNYTDNPFNIKYPISPTHGTDLEGHITANSPKIPLPDYSNPNSRLNYAKQFTQKYGSQMQGRGDTPLRINETMDEATDSAKNLSIKAAKPLGLDPALVYSSAMEEGMSGLFKDKKGESDFSGNKDYPTGGFYSFGIDDFTDKVPGLIKKGYLPSDFANQFVKHPQVNEEGRTVNSADFKSPDAGLQAKAALMRDFQDQTDGYAKKNGVTLTPKQRDFFTLVAYNSGGNMHKMMSEYKQKGFLTDSKVDKDPTGHWTTITKHIAPRLAMRDALKKEGLF